VQNYFNYFTEIEERFQQRLGTLLLLSTVDWALIETWQEAGVPLEAVLRGIDAAFEKYHARRHPGHKRRINGLAWCAQAVMVAAEELREAGAGASTTTNYAGADSGFERERVAAHLEAAAAALQTSTVAADVCAETASRLCVLADEIRAADPKSQVDAESLERNLTVLERKLFIALTAAAPVELLVAIKEHAARELAPYRSRMGAVQLRQVESQFEQKQLLANYNLPRLSLFYLSQQ
jgi:hypothetical protein